MQRAPINKVIPFSSVDGPGNRTAIFLQGCNWDCQYCHNPETRNLCVGCGLCVLGCPQKALSLEEVQTTTGSKKRVEFREEQCVLCDQCIQVCPNGCSPRILNLTAEEVFVRVKRQQPFIRGVTVSGGECCLYPEFLTELFTLCKAAGLHTMLDSNGSIDLRAFPELLEVTDGVMLDIKAYEEEEHRIVTGASNQNTLANTVFLAQKGKLFEVRTVVVPGLFDAEDTIRKTAALLRPFLEKGSIRYKLITYRPMGVRKQYDRYESPSVDRMLELERLARQEGFQDVVIL